MSNGETLHQQVIGIPIVISTAHLLANIFLMIHKYQFMEKLEKDNIHQAWWFNFTSRYIDDLISLNNPTFDTFILAIYPKELQIKQENSIEDSASYLEFQCGIQDEQLYTSLFDKHDSFNFSVVNYHFVEQSNILETRAYGVYTSHLICRTRVCDLYKDFQLHHNNLCLELYHQRFKYHKLCKHLQKTLQNHNVLFAKYDIWPEAPLPVLASNTRHWRFNSSCPLFFLYLQFFPLSPLSIWGIVISICLSVCLTAHLVNALSHQCIGRERWSVIKLCRLGWPRSITKWCSLDKLCLIENGKNNLQNVLERASMHYLIST